MMLGGVGFTISYPHGSSQPFTVRMYYPFGVRRPPGDYQLIYFGASFREGAITVDGKEYAVAITENEARGDYSDAQNTTVMIGREHDKVIETHAGFRRATRV